MCDLGSASHIICPSVIELWCNFSFPLLLSCSSSWFSLVEQYKACRRSVDLRWLENAGQSGQEGTSIHSKGMLKINRTSERAR